MNKLLKFLGQEAYDKLKKALGDKFDAFEQQFLNNEISSDDVLAKQIELGLLESDDDDLDEKTDDADDEKTEDTGDEENKNNDDDKKDDSLTDDDDDDDDAEETSDGDKVLMMMLVQAFWLTVGY